VAWAAVSVHVKVKFAPLVRALCRPRSPARIVELGELGEPCSAQLAVGGAALGKPFDALRLALNRSAFVTTPPAQLLDRLCGFCV
jgi:hypothetical protein